MVFLNYSTMQMVAKVVYYGPGLCGKTTNLKEIYRKTSSKSRGEMVSLETETDRTLFFDLLPMDVGVIGGFKTKFQLYTVPGQVFYNSTRKLVLRGVDGIVFVADSQVPMMEANQSSLENLQENLQELGLDIQEIPLVFQYNKRDLPNITPSEELNQSLNFLNRPFIEASALQGLGVFETLKEISKQTLLKLRAKALGKELQNNQKPVSLTVRGDHQKLKNEIKDESGQGKLQVEAENTVIKTAEMEASKAETMPHEVSFEAYSNDMEDTLDNSGMQDNVAEDASLPDVGPSEKVEDSSPAESGEEPEEKVEAEGEPSLASLGLDFSEEDFDDEDSLDLDEFEGLDDSLGDLDLDEEEGPDTVSEPVPDQFEVPEDSLEEISAPQTLETAETEASEPAEEAPVATADQEPAEPRPTEAAEAETAHPVARDEDRSPPREKPGPAKKRALSSTLKELESIASQVTGKPAKSSGSEASVDSLLSSLVADTGKKKARLERVQMTAPGPIDRAQLNCVLLDKADNVVHTQLLKVTPQAVAPGRYQVRVLVDIEVEEP